MEIKRDIIRDFEAWKDRTDRKPILLQGARQVGKSWIMEEFGRQSFQYCAKFDFDRQPELRSAFVYSKSPERILKELSLYSSVPLEKGKTLLLFDEIQECEEALNSLKYFYQEAPEWHIIAAGSLLGVAVRNRKMSVPVGKVEMMTMYPITFREFLSVADPATYEFVREVPLEPLPEIILNKLNLEYKRYLVSGGMPEAVTALLDGQGMEAVDQILGNIISLYELDFAKYAEARDIPRIRAVWHSLPAQLGKENRKFIFSQIRSGARSKDYEDALLWLEDAGLIYRIFNITKPGLPLTAYKDPRAFKAYAGDCGLLRRLAGLPPESVLAPTAGYVEFKGALAENAVLQSLLPMLKYKPHYWSNDNRAEIEFVLQWGQEIIPVEVKAESRISGKSLSVYNQKFSPDRRIRFSSQNLKENGGLLSIPSPLACWLPSLLASGK